MNDAIAVRTGVYEQFESTDEYLDKLSDYGNPRLSNTGNREWLCTLEMFVTGEGVEFKIRPSSKERTPLDASRKCYELMIKALEELK